MRLGMPCSRNKALQQTGSALCLHLASKTDLLSLSKPCHAWPCLHLPPLFCAWLVLLAPSAAEKTTSDALCHEEAPPARVIDVLANECIYIWRLGWRLSLRSGEQSHISPSCFLKPFSDL